MISDFDRWTSKRGPAAAALGVVATLGLLAALGPAGCATEGKLELPPPGAIHPTWSAVDTTGGPWNVLLLTLDTTRQDRFGCYGSKEKLTPNMDALADKGVVFEDAITPVPITLPSHVTILTGIDPPHHGVRNNGTFVLEPRFVTLAEILHDRGYATGATIGSIPLESRYGLNQGFDTYDDDLPNTGSPIEPEQRRADEITDLTLQWIQRQRQEQPQQPFFHFSHYYDPHYPYEPPEPFRSQHANSYDGEIAYMDAQIGRLIEGLRSLDLLRNTWIVIVADHGEAFGEHGEIYHSILIYRETMDVPFILVPPEAWKGLPGADLRGRRVPELVRLQDIMPTVMNALGLPEETFAGHGASLLPLLAGTWPGPQVTYLESLVPYLKYGWCELRGARTGDWTYKRAPESEQYNHDSDPAEAKNVHSKHPELARRLEAWCAHLAGNEEELKPQQLDQETIEKLRSLGYVGMVGPVGASVNNKDPKKLMGVFQLTVNARTALDARNPAEARRILEDALRQDPDNPEATRLLGSALVQLGQPAEAIPHYQALRKRYPESLQFTIDEAYANLLAGQIDQGARLLREVLDQEPSNTQALELYPRALARSGRAEEARAFLRGRAEGSRNSSQDKAAALVALAQFEWEQNEHGEAAKVAGQAAALDPKAAGAHTIVGLWWLEQALRKAAPDGSGVDEAALARAKEPLRRALEITPAHPQAGSRMAWILHHEKKDQEALNLLIAVASGNPANPLSQIEAGQALHQQNRLREAIPYYERALGMGYMEPGFLANCGLAYAAAGNRARARDLLQRALGMNPPPELAQSIQRNLAALTQAP